MRCFLNLLPAIKRRLPSPATRLYPDPCIHENCPEFEVNKWIVSDFVIHELVPVVGISPFPIDEQLLLAAAVCRFKPGAIFEWGTNVGKSARIFYETARHFRIPARIHSVDLPDSVYHSEHPYEKRGEFVKGLKNIFLYQGDGMDTCLGIYRNTPTRAPPLFFLDGDHGYASVQRELQGIARQVDNPILIIHDTFYQSRESGYNTGPHRAVEEFLGGDGNNFEKLSAQSGLPGLTVLYRKKMPEIQAQKS